jgi:hypothetical protein
VCVMEEKGLAPTGIFRVQRCWFWGVFVTREHVRHNKSGITHRDRAKINHLRELPYQVNPLCSGFDV